ncbi:MAG: D-ribose pyranase [Caldithrix sp.]|nr:D-ribose pyranase [Caldithrix sp.]
MKKHGILHAQLNRIIAAMGHGDMLVIGDSGLPIPHGKEVVDLALAGGILSFGQVLTQILRELCVEKVYVARETREYSPQIQSIIEGSIAGIQMQTVNHEQFKEITRETTNITFVRTGEQTPFSNIILVSGVTF